MSQRIAILPQSFLDASKRAFGSQSSPSLSGVPPVRFLRLPNPRTAIPTLYLPNLSSELSSKDGAELEILEVQAVDPTASRSWFLNNESIIEDGRLFVFTPVDPIFLLIPILHATAPNDGKAGLFRQLDDLIELATSALSKTDEDDEETSNPSPKPSLDIAQLLSFQTIQKALLRVADSKTLDGPDHMQVYRFSMTKTIQALQAKVSRLSDPSVSQISVSISRSLAKDGLGPDENVSEELRILGRKKIACNLLSQYLPAEILEALVASYDFTNLEAYIDSIRAEEEKSAPPPPIKEEKTKGGAKKRKAESQASKGVSKLQKVNTAGMNKLTSFFNKKASETVVAETTAPTTTIVTEPVPATTPS